MNGIVDNWPYWFVTAFVIVAAYIDGKELRVPNKITYPMIIAGWIYSMIAYQLTGEGWYVGLGWSLAGTAVGLATLKMMAGIGAWIYCTDTFYAFCVSAIVGALLSVGMILWAKQGRKHWDQFFFIFNEIMTVKNPETLATIAAERKSSMRLLPYGIPIAIGTVGYFAWMGMLI
jgi:prepilin peptidase CpaA